MCRNAAQNILCFRFGVGYDFSLRLDDVQQQTSSVDCVCNHVC